jgi:nucleotide-binding universal stress UspA family protein
VTRSRSPSARPPGSGPVVVGVDGSAAGRVALTFAADLTAWAAPLVAVHTWADVVDGIHGGVRRTEDPAMLAAAADAVLKAEVDTVAVFHPGLPVQRDVVGSTPVRAFLDRAGGARVLVVGHRGNTGSGMLHSSTSRTLVEFAPCPVLVISAVAVPTGQISTARWADSMP